MGYSSLDALLSAAVVAGSIGEAVISLECEETGDSREEVFGRLSEALDVMEAAVSTGLTGEEFSSAIAAALAVAEVNASMGRVVAAPTGGASGVLPGVLFTVAKRTGASRERLALALAAAGGIGVIITAKASLSGASSGCQAEIGSGAAMAAAAEPISA